MEKRGIITGAGIAALIAVLAVSNLGRPIDIGDFAPQESGAPLPTGQAPIRLLFVGDVMFDRGVANHADKHGIESLLRGVADLFSGMDAVIGNLEGTITTQESVARRDSSILHFTFEPKYAALLKSAGFTAVSLANNHSTDFLQRGLKETKSFLAEAGVEYFGDAYNSSTTGELSVRIERHGRTICLVGYHDLYTHDESPAVAEIARMRPDCSFVAVLPHWGIEYETAASKRQKMLAHAFIDAGADLVIGAHPHVVQPVEIYKNRAIFYSLGNFIFDQGLSFWTEHGLAVEAVIEDARTRYRLIPTELNKTEVGIAEGEARQKILQAAGSETALIVLDSQ